MTTLPELGSTKAGYRIQVHTSRKDRIRREIGISRDVERLNGPPIQPAEEVRSEASEGPTLLKRRRM